MIVEGLEVGLDRILAVVTENPELHAKWLNTVSYMEHIGATKIARTQSGKDATLMTLKHASEEARHAFFLKRMSDKIYPGLCESYADEFLLAPIQSRQYLNRLDIEISRLVRRFNLTPQMFRWTTYLFVTWAIELRADEIYPVYQKYLADHPVKVSVLSIINEEAGHLEEMENAMSELPFNTVSLRKAAREVEEHLWQNWIEALSKELPLS